MGVEHPPPPRPLTPRRLPGAPPRPRPPPGPSARGNCRPSLSSAAALLRQRSPLARCIQQAASTPRPGPGCGGRGEGGVKRLGQAKARACAASSLAGVGVRPRVRNPCPWSLSSPLIPASPAPGPPYLPSRPPFLPAPHPRGWKGPCTDAPEEWRGQDSGAGTSHSALVTASARERARGRGGKTGEARRRPCRSGPGL